MRDLEDARTEFPTRQSIAQRAQYSESKRSQVVDLEKCLVDCDQRREFDREHGALFGLKWNSSRFLVPAAAEPRDIGKAAVAHAICTKDPRIKTQKTAVTRDTVSKRDSDHARLSQLMHAMQSKPGIRENQFRSSSSPLHLQHRLIVASIGRQGRVLFGQGQGRRLALRAEVRLQFLARSLRQVCKNLSQRERFV